MRRKNFGIVVAAFGGFTAGTLLGYGIRRNPENEKNEVEKKTKPRTIKRKKEKYHKVYEKEMKARMGYHI